MKKILITILLLILSVFALSACTPGVKSEREMKIDIQNYLNSLEDKCWDINKLTVTERKTSKKDGTDVVNVEIEAKTEYSKGIYSLVLNYKLYDQGWFFENAQRNSEGKKEVKATKEPEQSTIENIIFKEYPDAKLKDKDILLDENKCVYYYENIYNKKYAKVTYIVSLTFGFDTEILGWENIGLDVIERNYEWDIIGTWYPTDERTMYGAKVLLCKLRNMRM